ncbi:MAG: amidohydrolase [Candidatus Cloacimonetes bacterium]|nr:amidohydrolase [Candidatus Cloacimonadota bacterium]
MQKILIKNVLLAGSVKDILIAGNTVSRIGSDLNTDSAEIINGSGLAALPALYNMHTHTAMSLFRGYADDMALMPWLQEKIWPQESKLTEEDVYQGTRFGILEMIKAGTVLANDMYWHWKGEARAAQEMGIRFINGFTLIDFHDEARLPELKKDIQQQYEDSSQYGELVEFSLAPHAVYTVSEKTLRWAAEFASEKQLKLHIHVSETEQEVIDCLRKTGLTPLQYLDKIGFLGNNVIAAHMVWLDDKDFDIVKKHNLTVAHCPVSNMKLSSGIFKYSEFLKRGIPVCVATDGPSSNNNLDLFEEMKFAAILPKISMMNPELAAAENILQTTTLNPAKALGLAAGEVKEGNLADIILVDLDNINLIPNHNLSSNLVYSAHADCVHTTICNGKILMHNRRIKGEQEIIAGFRKTIEKLRKA